MVVVGTGTVSSLVRADGRSHFNELDLQLMLDKATGYHEDHEDGRWAIETKWNGKDWLVIVEPVDDRVLVVVTAYPVN
jgi:hypothetical protein